MILNHDGALENLTRVTWPLTPARSPVTGSLVDAEALGRGQDGSILVGFEGTHRIWRYEPPPHTFASTPTPIAVPAELSRAPRNGGIEGLTTLPDSKLLALTEEFANPDDSFKGWLLDGNRFAGLSYLPTKGFRVTDCAALKNGDVLVLERRYVPIGVLSARLTLVDGKTIRPGGLRQELIHARIPSRRRQLRRRRRSSRPPKARSFLPRLRRQLHPFNVPSFYSFC